MIHKEKIKDIKGLHLPPYDEIYDKTYRRLGRILSKSGESAQSKADQILDTAFNIIANKLGKYTDFYRLILKNEYYKTYLSILFGEKGMEKMREAAYLKNRVKYIYRMGKRHVKLAPVQEKIQEALSYAGRMLSIPKRKKRLLEEIIEIKKEASLIPGRGEAPPIIIAGPPNAGKSTLMKRIAYSRTKVGDYPFTTRKAVPGRFLGTRIINAIAIDTPGIMDLDTKGRTTIERRAIAMLRFPRAIILFLIDPDPNSSLPLDKQIELANNLRLYNPRVLPVVNKADVYPSEAEKIRARLREEGWARVYVISALTGDGLKDLIEDISRSLKETLYREALATIGIKRGENNNGKKENNQ